jgi:hypothetical protein
LTARDLPDAHWQSVNKLCHYKKLCHYIEDCVYRSKTLSLKAGFGRFRACGLGFYEINAITTIKQ